ncbi:MAG: Tim44 domain-containing protein [Burkholderiaceae bacterium]
MKKLWMALMIAILGASLSVGNAEAKRMGGGGSMGKSSPSYSRQAPMQQSGQQAAPAQRPAQPAAPAPAPSSPWKGILGGALLGLGLGALLSHLGMGAEFASMLGSVLMIALFAIAGLFIFRMLTRKAAPAQPVPAYAGPMERSITPEIGSNLEQTGTAPAPLNWQSGHATSVPEGFDAAGFLRHAKTNFIRMQAAWDKADVNDIREFTTPEMFAELKMQLTERGASPNHTDVVSLDAELLGIETTSDEYVASIRFSGMVREAENVPTEAFSEIWVLSKPVSGSGGWLLAGLQQT